jgi:hypothetical protein
MTRTPRLKSLKVVSDMVFTEVCVHYVSSFSSHLFHRKKSFGESQPLDSVFVPYVKGVTTFKCIRSDITLKQSSGWNICTSKSLHIWTRWEGNPQQMTHCVQYSGLQHLRLWNKQTISCASVLTKVSYIFICFTRCYLSWIFGFVNWCNFSAIFLTPVSCVRYSSCLLFKSKF